MTQSTFSVKPISKEDEKKINYGAVVEGLDLNNISGKSALLERPRGQLYLFRS
jgi:hypothetical protein